MKNQNNNLRFFWNGIKVGKGKLQKASFNFIKTWTDGQGRVIPTQIAIYAGDYYGFSADVRKVFDVQNNTDSMTDYFEKDKIRVTQDHPMWDTVAVAYVKQEERYIKRGLKKAEKTGVLNIYVERGQKDLATFKELFAA